MDSYGHLFPDLPAWSPGGEWDPKREDVLDYLEELAHGLYGDGPDHSTMPAAYTYLGQFANHDITFDPIATPSRRVEPLHRRNIRTPRLDLDALYGTGPRSQPYLYWQRDPRKLLVGANEAGEPDLPRSRDDSTDRATTDHFNRRRPALVSDPRNDQNIIISQLHLAFIGFHNRQVDETGSFVEAARLTRWHYQWVVLHDLLPRLCGAEMVDRVLGSGRTPALEWFRKGTRPLIPYEFNLAAFRAGHSLARPSYHLNDTLEVERRGVPLWLLKQFAHRNNLAGGRELPKRWTIQWDRFLEHNGSEYQPSKCIDQKIAKPLENLPLRADRGRMRSLAYRTLAHGWYQGLPSGQSVAHEMGVKVIEGNDPLFVYVLREAEQSAEGRRLGPVGGRIVAEVLVGLLACDPTSFYREKPKWQPRIDPEGQSFELRDFLRHAGAPMAVRDWQSRRGRIADAVEAFSGY